VRALTTGAGEDMVDDRNGCTICRDEKGHGLTACNSFMSMNPSQRLKAVMELRNCFRCLGRNHGAKDCKKVDIKCTASGCGGPHHPLLHGGHVDTPPRKREGGNKKKKILKFAIFIIDIKRRK